MNSLLLVLLLLPADVGISTKKVDLKKVPAQVTVTAEVGCLHCEYGMGEMCASVLKLGKKTPLVLAGKSAKQLKEACFERRFAVVQGVLTLDKNKRLLLTSDKAKLLGAKEKARALSKIKKNGPVLVQGLACCAKCDLGLTKVCNAAIRNGKFAIVISGKLAHKHTETGDTIQPVQATGKLFVDKRGLLRLEAVQLEWLGKKTK